FFGVLGVQKNIFESVIKSESVFVDRNIMSPHYTPDKLPFRENQIDEITQVLGTTLNGKRADNLFVYGKVGTGKTVTVKYVLQQLEEFSKQNNVGADTTYVNCRTHNSKYKVLLSALRKFYPDENFIGFSSAFVYEKLLEYADRNKRHLVLTLDEVDKVKDVDELIYALSRGNDELVNGSVSLIGISNNLVFKDRLDPRTKSSLCEKEMVFSPYNAKELKAILSERTAGAFRKGSVEESAINCAAAVSAQESGDARTAVMLLLRAGELADKSGLSKVSDTEVKNAKSKVEEEIIFNMIKTLPSQQQLVLYAISSLVFNHKGVRSVTGLREPGVLFSGEVYDEYKRVAKSLEASPISSRWYRQYINELEIYGLIITTQSGKGIRGSTRLIRLGFDAKKIRDVLGAEIFA
ncbi:MAG: AAA family ATPase, partial [archaeon]|nr:AAA family ATPase [archaeon]